MITELSLIISFSLDPENIHDERFLKQEICNRLIGHKMSNNGVNITIEDAAVYGDAMPSNWYAFGGKKKQDIVNVNVNCVCLPRKSNWLARLFTRS